MLDAVHTTTAAAPKPSRVAFLTSSVSLAVPSASLLYLPMSKNASAPRLRTKSSLSPESIPYEELAGAGAIVSSLDAYNHSESHAFTTDLHGQMPEPASRTWDNDCVALESG